MVQEQSGRWEEADRESGGNDSQTPLKTVGCDLSWRMLYCLPSLNVIYGSAGQGFSIKEGC